MLTESQLASFREDGFLVVPDVLDDDDLIPLEKEYEEVLEAIATEQHSNGKIASRYDELPFADRYAKVVAESPECVDYFNISLPLVNGTIDTDHYRAHIGPAVFGLLSNAKILDVVESVIGGEIASSPVQQMRMKPPQKSIGSDNVAHSNVGLTTWHQDTVAVLPEADDTNQLTVWVAVTDANETNGCLVSIPGSHKEGAHRHVPGHNSA